MDSLDIRAAEIAKTSREGVQLLDRLLAKIQDDYCQDCGSDLYCERCDAYWVGDVPCSCRCQTCDAERTEETCSHCGGEEFSRTDAVLARARRKRNPEAKP